ncbi:ATP phosphoribosyltransferase regulatory subunit [Lentibacillus persicus]|uniref:ATP phosphoribosyltransferase regulatory subunit n=1 Tax=Lentibacillus persicus TaxID=640948 RepID=A0A1I1YAE0_9BACI|nr:ATP phosphoribosyltransferase regulatory subunit [Lentibacillus persicus]SFE15063.1 ATP phosphoribosyltransferase regulatory subunit [Lentibacillus persicus]
MRSFMSSVEGNLSPSDYQLKNSLITTIKNRFRTYGYQETGTKTFQDYDVYSSVIGTVHKQNMIKTIDSSGEVLVLRPDVTIPITRRMAADEETDDRLFYVENIFRQLGEDSQNKEFTQAGVECFGENASDSDAEMIALAVHVLQDLKFEHFKIEIGHAGFFKDLINELPLSDLESEKLQELIQSKNMAEVGPFLEELQAEKHVINAVKAIPLLYGDPKRVLEKAESIIVNDSMKTRIDNLKYVYGILKAYGVENSVVFDLGLINHMNYYSGIIFQGYITGYSKPVLMGGRYDHLAEQFGRATPAIGFGCIVDDIFKAQKASRQLTETDSPSQLTIRYDSNSMKDALAAANYLRDSGVRVITENTENHNQNVSSRFIAQFKQENAVLFNQQEEWHFQTADELLILLKREMREG